MDNNYWNVFKETGDPISFLLCRAALITEKEKSGKKKEKKENRRPDASV